MKHLLLAFALVVAFASIALGQTAQAPRKHEMTDLQKPEMHLYPTAEIKWNDGPASLPAGAKVAVLEGDPTKEGFFTMRLWLPDGFKIQPHWHPKVEHVTVISGTLMSVWGRSLMKRRLEQCLPERLASGLPI